MTQTPERIPEFDLADRMRKSLRAARIDVQEMAAYLGVSRTSVSNWINGRVSPSMQTQRLWALRTGVPFEWLRDDSPRTAATVSEEGQVTRGYLKCPGHRLTLTVPLGGITADLKATA